MTDTNAGDVAPTSPATDGSTPADAGPTADADAPSATPSSGSDGPAGQTPETVTGSYELLAGRLRSAGVDLRAATEQLNHARSEVFATATLTLAETDRLRTDATAVARDVVGVGDVALFGYNVTTLSTSLRSVPEVFALYRPRSVSDSDWDFVPLDPDDPDWFLDDPAFVRDFGELFTYYAQARLLTLRIVEDHLLMVFGIGETVADIRVLRWRLDRGGQPTYIDAYGDNDLIEPDRFDFAWIEVGRDKVSDGRDPLVEIAGELHLALDTTDPAAATIAFRIDDAVEGGQVVLVEPVAESGQAITELRIAYARVGDLILVRVLPYRETVERFYVYNRLTRELVRDDPLGVNARILPGDQGVIFPGGYHLTNGEARTFATDAAAGVTGRTTVPAWNFHARHVAPNGEDVLYAYHDVEPGRYLLCGYNVVTKTMANPIMAAGYAVFDDGVIVCLRAADEPSRVHAISVYTSPFCVPESYAPPAPSDSFFGRIGNPELVAVLGECFALSRDVDRVGFVPAVFEAFVTRTRKLLDTHAWLDEPEARQIGHLLLDIRRTAGDILDELAAVNAARKAAHDALARTRVDARDFIVDAGGRIDTADAFIEMLARGRAHQGSLATLAELRFVDVAGVAELTTTVAEAYTVLADRALDFLAAPDALTPLLTSIAEARARAEEATSAAIAVAAGEDIDRAGERIVLLTEVVSSLETDDAPHQTRVLETLADALARRNGAAAVAAGRAGELRATEDRGQFAASMAVLTQRAATASMTSSDTTAIDGALAALGAEISTLEARFGDVDEFAEALADKRDQIYGSLTQRRDVLAAARQTKIDRLVTSAERALTTIEARASGIADREAFEGYFATDPLVARVRSSIAQLRQDDESARAGELVVALDAARSRARRAAADRAELFGEDGMVRLGRHRFGVNTTPFDLRLVPDPEDAERLELRLGGTDLAVPVPPVAFGALTDAVSQVHPAETPAMPRALFLALTCLSLGIGADPAAVRAEAQRRLDEGYEIGVHDVDAAAIADVVAPVLESPLGRFHAGDRAVAGAWFTGLDDDERSSVALRLAALRALASPKISAERWSADDQSAAEISGAGAPAGSTLGVFTTQVRPALVALADAAGISVDVPHAVAYLVAAHDELAVTAPAHRLAVGFADWAHDAGLPIDSFGFAELNRFVTDWAAAATAAADADGNQPVAARCAEAAFVLVGGDQVGVTEVDPVVAVDGLLSSHPLIGGGRLRLDVDLANGSFETYRRDALPRFVQAAAARRAYLDQARRTLDLDAIRPAPLPTFVRNRLIGDVYLPLIADNFAKQLGMTTSAQGLLMLISPPGYGKTTLIEYVANLLGFALVKVNGPALGRDVTSLDPSAAPDTAAAAELVKLNRAFAMGTNVMLYIDDIQHTSAELLSRFIPLCDATRRIDGVLDGEARTWNLAGKRFVMVMAGNPYSAAGETFRLPDMLTNRADVFNLGDVLAGHADAFAASYLEVASGSNATLAPVVAAPGDLGLFLDTRRGNVLDESRLSRAYTPAEINAVQQVLAHLASVRDQLLAVNDAYIASASVDDTMRGEPPFLLQGSYRNMAKIAARVVAQMTAAEVDAVVADHYRQEAQTLGPAASWNLARLAELRRSTPEAVAAVGEMRERWRAERADANPITQVTRGLSGIERALRDLEGPVGGSPPRG